MPLPAALRHRVPHRWREDPRLRAVAVGAGLIPPRALHSGAEAELLARCAAAARVTVEIGVFEGASAVALVRALPAGARLHLVDPYGEHPTALFAGHRATEGATRRVVGRAARGTGVELVWHVARSEDVAARWDEPVDLVFIDGDHAERGVRQDWELWSPHVAPGGRAVFHDARLGAAHGLPGPTAVVDAVLRPPPPGWRIEAEVDSAVVARRNPPATPPSP